MLVCVLGTLFNLANILVLTHTDMRNPVNMILTGMAVADFLNNFEYIPFTAHMNLLDTEARSIEDEVSCLCMEGIQLHRSTLIMNVNWLHKG